MKYYFLSEIINKQIVAKMGAFNANIAAIASLLFIFGTRASFGASLRPKVILVSMDGFRYDYLTKANTTNFSKMLDSGVSMPYINNTFVTVTFPCHYTMVTGKVTEQVLATMKT